MENCMGLFYLKIISYLVSNLKGYISASISLLYVMLSYLLVTICLN